MTCGSILTMTSDFTKSQMNISYKKPYCVVCERGPYTMLHTDNLKQENKYNDDERCARRRD